MIRMQNVTFQYSEETAPILKNISLDISAGEIILLMGPTGSGKTTLLQVLAGIAPLVTGGTIEGGVFFEEIDVLRNPGTCRGKIGLVFQDPELQLVNSTVEDEVAFGPENLLLPKAVVLERVNWAIEKCRLTEQRNSFVYALSGGQKQRIAIAAGLSMQPDLLLMDGPLTNLDPIGSAEVLATINDLIRTETTKTVVIASNKVDALLPLVTRVIVLVGGQIVLDATETGERGLCPPFDRRRIRDNPLVELAGSYFNGIPDASRRPNSELYNWFKSRLLDRAVRGIIFRRYIWCDTWHAELWRLKEWINLPVLDIDVGGDNEAHQHRAPNRIRSFLETLS